MAKLTYQQRKRLKKSSFAVHDGEEKYPIPDKAHARAALAMSHGARSGKKASPAEHAAVHRKVRRKYPELYQEHMRRHHRKK
jgi:hypothetical protein